MNAVIYVRTSTKEQFPEKQLKDCVRFAEARGYTIIAEYVEKVSAFKKDAKRPMYEEIKEKARIGEIKAVVVWALDRWVRNRDTLLEDVANLTRYGCKLHSVREAYLEAVNIEGAIGKTIQDFLLGLIGSMAQLESQRKADRTHLAYQNRTGRWGRKPLPKRVVNEVLELHKNGETMRRIAQSVFYYDKNKNKKNLSLASVHKIIVENRQEKDTLMGC